MGEAINASSVPCTSRCCLSNRGKFSILERKFEKLAAKNTTFWYQVGKGWGGGNKGKQSSRIRQLSRQKKGAPGGNTQHDSKFNKENQNEQNCWRVGPFVLPQALQCDTFCGNPEKALKRGVDSCCKWYEDDFLLFWNNSRGFGNFLKTSLTSNFQAGKWKAAN